MQELTISSADEGQTLVKFLHKYLKEAPNSFLYKMLRKKNITLNDKKADGNERLNSNDTIKIFFTDETLAKFKGEGIGHITTDEYKKAYQKLKPLSIVYEDSDILILNKEKGQLSQKAEANDWSINEAMIGYLLSEDVLTMERLQMQKPSVCNRLDRNTSGLLLCGKTLKGSTYLNKILRDRSIQKFYLCIVKGAMTKACLVKGFLKKDETTNKVTITQSEVPDSQLIQTSYTPLSVSDDQDLTLLEVHLITGKSHQIRAHLAYIGHPLVGDYKYGDKTLNDRFKKEYGINSQMLHSYRVVFPKTSEFSHLDNQSFTAPLDQSFQTIIKDKFKWQPGIQEA